MIGIARVRDMEFPTTLTGRESFQDNGVTYSESQKVLNLWNFAHCEDRTNPVKLLGKTNFDIGGPFLSYRAKMEFPVVGSYVIGRFAGLRWAYEGPIVAYPQSAPTAWVPPSWWSFAGVSSADGGLDSVPDRWGMGATAISRCKPASPEASLGVFLTETYREGIPNLLSNFKNLQGEIEYFRSLGSNYLNVEFGWRPFVADLRKTARSVQKSHEILEDLRRNSGKRMRRRYRFPEISSTVETHRDGTLPYFTGQPYAGASGQRVSTTYSTKKTWFEGEFVYSFPAADSGIPKKVLAGSRQILGLDLTPETLWNITPWTWLADWFANSGDVISNISAVGADNLVMRYGYLMQEATRKYLTVHSGFTALETDVPSTFSGAAVYTAKSRIGASPYGFGLTMGDFTPRQVAILAAIGITRRSPGYE